MKKLTVFLLSRDRPDYARIAINSILSQSIKDFEFIISDNSTDFRLRTVISEEFPTVAYVSRHPGVSLEKHYELVKAETTTPYFVAFHDDDEMDPKYVERILLEFERNPQIGAIGTNGVVIDESGYPIGNESFFGSDDPFLKISSAECVINRYLSSGFGGVAPFSSYAYRTESLQGISIYQGIARNYFDAIFLSILASRHGIGWINLPLVRVRYHDKRISSKCGVSDYKAFITAIRSLYGPSLEEKHIQEYRFANFLFALRIKRKVPLAALKYFFCTGIRLMLTSENFRSRVAKKAAKF